jgi:hypothetical protein
VGKIVFFSEISVNLRQQIISKVRCMVGFLVIIGLFLLPFIIAGIKEISQNMSGESDKIGCTSILVSILVIIIMIIIIIALFSV